MRKLEGKVAIVTGSTSGMGRATALLFAREGAKVVVTGRNEERAKAVVDQIKADGGEGMYLLVDTSKPEDAKILVDKTVEAYGTVDILYNNAGALSLSPLQELTLEEWNRVFNVNVTSALVATQQVAPIMKAKGKGVILNTASVASFAAHHGFAAYIASKHAMAGLTKSIAFELGPEIRCNAIAPRDNQGRSPWPPYQKLHRQHRLWSGQSRGNPRACGYKPDPYARRKQPDRE